MNAQFSHLEQGVSRFYQLSAIEQPTEELQEEVLLWARQSAKHHRSLDLLHKRTGLISLRFQRWQWLAGILVPCILVASMWSWHTAQSSSKSIKSSAHGNPQSQTVRTRKAVLNRFPDEMVVQGSKGTPATAMSSRSQARSSGLDHASIERWIDEMTTGTRRQPSNGNIITPGEFGQRQGAIFHTLMRFRQRQPEATIPPPYLEALNRSQREKLVQYTPSPLQ